MENAHLQNFLSDKIKKIFQKQEKFEKIVRIFENELGVNVSKSNIEIKHSSIVLKKMSSLQKTFLKQNHKRILSLIQQEIPTIQSVKFY